MPRRCCYTERGGTQEVGLPMHEQSTITGTVYRLVTLTVPTAITEGTDPALVTDALDVFYAAMHATHGPEATVDTLNLFAAAIQSGDAITVLYAHDGETTARTLFPTALMLTKDAHLVARCFCTLRRETKCFRLDRMTGAHLVTLPGEVAAA